MPAGHRQHQRVPISGTVLYLDQNLSEAGERQLTRYHREQVGFVVQFSNLIPSWTAPESVAPVTDIARARCRN